MTDRTNGTPRHLWIVGALSLLWNCIGAADYTMTQTRNSAWLQGITAEQLAYLHDFPTWAVSAWALGVWGALAGSILLLLRSAGLSVAEVPVTMHPRTRGTSRIFMSWRRVARYMLESTLLCVARWHPRQRTRS